MAKLASGRSARWAFMEKFAVPDYDRPDRNYLTRWRLIQTPWFGIYLHRFDGPDPRPTLHDHPWNFRSLVLLGGYEEALTYAEGPPGLHGSWAQRRAGRWNRKHAEDTHTITELWRVPTWTLMLVGRRRREWGYVDPDGTWTRFDLHAHAAEFDAALAARLAATPSPIAPQREPEER